MSFCLINSINFKHNIKVVSKYIDINKIAFVIKNNAYGHGLLEMARLANESRIKHAIVISSEEAKLVEDFFDTILVLSDISSISKSKKIRIAINDLESINKIPSSTLVELKVDTGMHRNGIHINDLDRALERIESRGLLLKGVFTHFADPFKGNSIFNQKDLFDKVRQRIDMMNIGDDIRFHCSSSPGVFRIDNSEYDMVRVGIALYGYVDLPNDMEYPDLKPVLSLWAERISTRNILQGDRVGYGGVFKAKNNMQISTYDIGYGDGFMRLDENKMAKISDGRDVLGRVSMNNLAIAGNDQEICIFDNVNELSKVHNTISYEILCRINNNIEKRIV